MEYGNGQTTKKAVVQRKSGANNQTIAAPGRLNGRAEIRNILTGGALQAKLTVGDANDKYEQEADQVADDVMRMPDSDIQRQEEPGEDEEDVQRKPLLNPAPMQIQRMCPKCQEELNLRREVLDEDEEQLQAKSILQRNPEADNDSGEVSRDVEQNINNLRTGGQPLETNTRSFFESRMGYDFGGVRLHVGDTASKVARSVNARAFTVGKDIVMGKGEYQPGTDNGKRLLGHELTHVVQQGASLSRKAKKKSSTQKSETLIQRTTHGRGGPAYTPTNCANPMIPLSARMAGIAAHGQIDAVLAGLGIHPQAIPRATKRRMSSPSPGFGTNIGFADLWTVNGGTVRIAETKSTNIGHARARREANHYVTRHNQWNARWPNAFPDDATYRLMVGAHPVPGAVLSLFPFTGTGLALGPFVADPGKILFAEGDALGAMVYWCQGPGIINPLLVWLLKQALDKMRDYLNSLRDLIEDLFDNFPPGVGPVPVPVPVPAPRPSPALTPAQINQILAMIVLLIALILAVVAIACLAGVITSPCAPFAAGGALAFAAIGLILLGIDMPGVTSGRDPLMATLRREHYANPSTGGSNSEAEGIARNMAASISALADPSAIASRVQNNLDDARARSFIQTGIQQLRTAGRSDDAEFVTRQMNRLG